MRDDVMMSLVDRALNDNEFRTRAAKDLDGTLAAYGYDLTEDELAAVRDFQSQTAGKSGDEIQQLVADRALQHGG